jgi:leucyl-tRNA synthetase
MLASVRQGSVFTRIRSFDIVCSRRKHTIAGLSDSHSGPDIVSLTDIDKKWGKKWKDISPNGSIYPLRKDRNAGAEKKFITSMFPYPSGMLHIGHLRVYTISDAIARFNRAQGRDIIHPMGWDAFGLPAENAAIERNIHPGVWTKDNIGKMKEQMELMLADFDWEREVTTCNPDYYKWTQKIFTLLYQHGLAYRKEAEINWDPIDQTVLANEQVDAEGRSWRSGAIVEKRQLSQWFLGITKFAESLNKDLETLTEWPNKVKLMQKHWIGESHGVEIKFVSNHDAVLTSFTTRADTIYSIQYVAVALSHPIVQEQAKSNVELQRFLEVAKDLPEDSKAGFQLATKVANPFKPGKFDIPVFAAPYVLGSYGEGVVMGCPAHDERDFDFWRENKPSASIISTIGEKSATHINPDEPFFKKGRLHVDDPELNGLTSTQAIPRVAARLSELQLGQPKTQYRLRDWLISRQRFWGAPIPIIHCDSCGTVPVPDADLPVLLPDDVKMEGKGNPLQHLDSFINVKCPSCGSDAKRETDTMDTFMDSSWYYFRYSDPKNDQMPFSYENASKHLPVDLYIGGVEHAILHLLYSRFISKFLSEINMWDGDKEHGEPFKKLVTQGMVHGKTYKNPDNGRFLKPDEIDLSDLNNPKIIATGETPSVSYEKMSKSKYNGADPGKCIESHGADATRAHILFQAPINQILDWDEAKISGVERWLRRVIQLSKQLSATVDDKIIHSSLSVDEQQLHNETEVLLQSITESFDLTLSLNTVISDYMKLTNAINSALENENVRKSFALKSYRKLLISMSPVTPAVSEESWEILLTAQGKQWTSILAEPWPEVEPLQQSTIKYNVLVNGKFRFSYEGDEDFYKNVENAKEKILETEQGKKLLEGKQIIKVITKPSAIVFVVKG